MTLAWPTDMLDASTIRRWGSTQFWQELLAPTLTELRCKTAILHSPSPSYTTKHDERPGDCVHWEYNRETSWRSICRTTCGMSWRTTGCCARVLLWRRSIRLSRPPVSTISWMM